MSFHKVEPTWLRLGVCSVLALAMAAGIARGLNSFLDGVMHEAAATADPSVPRAVVAHLTLLFASYGAIAISVVLSREERSALIVVPAQTLLMAIVAFKLGVWAIPAPILTLILGVTLYRAGFLKFLIKTANEWGN